MIKILIADDHKVFRQGIASIISYVEDIEVVGEAFDLPSIQATVEAHHPNVVLMDISMGDQLAGIQATRWIRAEHQEVHVLALSMHADHAFIVEMLEAGASGYLLKDTGKEELFRAIRTVSEGDSYYSKHASEAIIHHLSDKRKRQAVPQKNIPLTKRELEVLKLIVAEYSNAEIANTLYISVRTVDTHKRNLLEKLKLKNTAGLVKYALKHKLIEES